ncbi:MAG: polysaccharide deacetylase family protein, partial [Oscillospiraceae bacterium]|nr:polysaccharide deacetylase family protein [Oscillospiraceae bacterium]
MKNKRSMLIGWGAGVLSTTLVTGIITAVSASGGNVWGDVNKDGIVNIGDVIHLRRYLAGWDGYGDPDDTDATKTTGITRTTATTSYVDINGNLTSDKTTTSQSIWTDTPETTSINTITTLSTKTETAKTTTGTAFTTITTLATDLTTTNTTSTTAVTKTTALNTTNTAGTTAVTTTATVTTNTTASGERLYNGKPVLDWKPAPPNPWTWYAKGTLVLYDGYIWELNAVEVSYEDAVKDPNPIYDADNADPSVGYSAMRGNGAEPGGSWNFYVKRVAAPSEWDTSTTTAPSATSTSGDTQGGYQALYPLLDVSKSEPGAYLNESKLCYLTFDDGPNTATTPALLNKLDTLGIKATFFLVPRDTAESKALIKQIYDSG